jgi:nitrite reductase/ring-hydroxylating ferredoxin subunit
MAMKNNLSMPTRRELPDSWYPICRSRQLKRNRPLPIQAFGREWVVFRTGEGRCTAVQRHCCHMGTDLALGEIADNSLRCPLHHWRFDGDGKCIDIPASEIIPPDAKLEKLRCIDKFGIVFAAHGSENLFHFPYFADDFPGTPSASSRTKLISMAASYETVSLNLFDVQHLTTVHKRKLHKPAELFSDSTQHLGIRYSAYNASERIGNHFARWLGLSAADIHVDCWGGNLLLICIQGRRPNFIMALMPVTEYSCQLYLVMVESESNANVMSAIARRIKLELAASLTSAFISEDIRTLSNSRSLAGVLLPDADAEAIRFWAYFNSLPTNGLSA